MGRIDKRNKGRLAHGLRPVDTEDAKAFEQFARDVICRFLGVESLDQPLQPHTFCKPAFKRLLGL